MAKVIRNSKEITLIDGEQIKEVCEQLDVPFGCQQGICGTCKIEILEGADNLEPLNAEEKDMGDRSKKHRLACQARIKHGTIVIKIEGE